MRIRCTSDGYSFLQYPKDSNRGFDLCLRGVLQEANVPDGVSVIDIVFTTRRSRGYSWPITNCGGIRECEDQYILGQCSRVFRSGYDAGFRYFHIEY